MSNEEATPTGIAFSSDGTKAYAVGPASDEVFQYTLSTAWDLSTGSYALKSLDVSDLPNNPQSLTFSSDGIKAYVGLSGGLAYQYTLSTAWDISTASHSGKSFDFSAEAGSVMGIAFKSDGSVVYVADSLSDSAYQYTLTAATNPSPIDGVTLSNNDRVLLTAQSTATQNGVWVAVTATDPSTWTRATDLAIGDAAAGTHIAVDQGTTYYDTLWSNMDSADADTVGTHELTFSRIRSV